MFKNTAAALAAITLASSSIAVFAVTAHAAATQVPATVSPATATIKNPDGVKYTVQTTDQTATELATIKVVAEDGSTPDFWGWLSGPNGPVKPEKSVGRFAATLPALPCGDTATFKLNSSDGERQKVYDSVTFIESAEPCPTDTASPKPTDTASPKPSQKATPTVSASKGDAHRGVPADTGDFGDDPSGSALLLSLMFVAGTGLVVRKHH